MSQSTITVNMDENIMKQFNNLCAEFGMSASTALDIYVRAVIRERKIPFEITAREDPFFSVSNQEVLRSSIKQMEREPEKNVVKTIKELEELADD